VEILKLVVVPRFTLIEFHYDVVITTTITTTTNNNNTNNNATRIHSLQLILKEKLTHTVNRSFENRAISCLLEGVVH
jgi:hypothetical protein